MESGSRRRHNGCKVLVSFVVLLSFSFSFSLLRGSPTGCWSCGLDYPPFFFIWAALPLGSILERTLFGKRYMDIYNKAQIFVFVLDHNSIKLPRSTLRSCR